MLDNKFASTVRNSIYNTWNAIGYDISEAYEECGGELNNIEAIEAVIDANYMTAYGGQNGAAHDRLITDACIEHGYDAVLKCLSQHIKLC